MKNKSDKNEINTEDTASDNDVFDPLLGEESETKPGNLSVENDNNNDESIDVTNKYDKNEELDKDNNINLPFDVTPDWVNAQDTVMRNDNNNKAESIKKRPGVSTTCLNNNSKKQKNINLKFKKGARIKIRRDNLSYILFDPK